MPKISRMVRERNAEGLAARDELWKARQDEQVKLAMLQVLVRRELNDEKLRRAA